MQIEIAKNKLQEALKTVTPAVSQRSTLPVLACILLEAEGDAVWCKATNLEFGIAARTDCDMAEAGGICAPAKLFSDIIATHAGDTVHLETTPSSSLVISGAGSRTEIKCIPAEEFPPMPAHKLEGVVWPTVVLKRMIAQTEFAASKDEGRPTLQGINTVCQNGVVAMITTDGFRLSLAKETGTYHFENAIIPAKTMHHLSSLADGDTYYRKVGGQVIFAGADWQLVSQILDGTFPDYNVIMPRSFKTCVTIRRADLRLAVRRAQLLADGKPVILQVKQNAAGVPPTLSVTAESEENGQTSATLDCAVDGPAQVIAFNAAFLGQALDAFEGAEVALEINDGNGPARIRRPDTDGFVHVIMPMKAQ